MDYKIGGALLMGICFFCILAGLSSSMEECQKQISTIKNQYAKVGICEKKIRAKIKETGCLQQQGMTNIMGCFEKYSKENQESAQNFMGDVGFCLTDGAVNLNSLK
jgi:hypothetical protein